MLVSSTGLLHLWIRRGRVLLRICTARCKVLVHRSRHTKVWRPPWKGSARRLPATTKSCCSDHFIVSPRPLNGWPGAPRRTRQMALLDKAYKQRMVGALVLVALAVIFLPMLFSRQDEQRQVTVEAPAAPQAPALPQVQVEPVVVPEPQALPQEPVPSDDEIAQQEAAVPTAPVAPAPAAKPVAPAPAPAAKPATAPAQPITAA